MRELICRHPTAKDGYLSEVAISLLMSKWQWGRYIFPDHTGDYKLKADLTSYLLNGTRLECGDYGTRLECGDYSTWLECGDMQSMHLFMKRCSLGTTWLVPHRYLGDIAIVEPSQMVKQFFEKFNWYSKRLYFNDNYNVDEAFKLSDDNVLPQFMSCIQSISICIEDYKLVVVHMLKPSNLFGKLLQDHRH